MKFTTYEILEEDRYNEKSALLDTLLNLLAVAVVPYVENKQRNRLLKVEKD